MLIVMWYLCKHVPYYLVDHGNLIKKLYTMVEIISILFDAEHPSIFPMDTTSTTQAPSGPMTRARARAIQSEVNSLLVELPFDPLETWLLPQTEMLCVIR